MRDGLSIEVNEVSVRYRLAKEKPRTLQEYVIHRLKGKGIVYEDFWALRDVNLTIRKGESLGIIGRNGAGKSTLLKVIAGILKPSKGHVTANGSIAPMIELGAGFDMELTGKENIYLNASILGFSRKEIDRKLDAIVRFAELEEFIHSPLKSYSSGMISRLGFSIATEVAPDILIIDEVLAVGDRLFTMKSKQRIMSFRERETTIVFVSHTLEDVISLCDRVLWLDRGTQQMYGDSETVIDKYLETTGGFSEGVASSMPPESL